ncbi:hypothetical protein Tco_1043979 [Tanacetum coccineum]|uniref:Uncharacterized protein n=1 Tax=Tanacetum coccineum TaxID=301880 RepID=A0ABQ5GPV3_9ASTR
MCLRNAAKITHKAQSVTSLAAKWHTCATIDSFDDMGPTEETTQDNITAETNKYHFNNHTYSDNEEGDEDELDNTKLVPIYRHTITYQKRQALGIMAKDIKWGSIAVLGKNHERKILSFMKGRNILLMSSFSSNGKGEDWIRMMEATPT